MHAKGAPKVMQRAPRYKDLINEISGFLKNGAALALSSGVGKNSIVLDPGIGFGKTLRHNLKILKEIASFRKLGFPVMIGLSRKSFIGKMLGLDPGERLIPTVAANTSAIIDGADIIRVHDVKEAVWTREIINRIKRV